MAQDAIALTEITIDRSGVAGISHETTPADGAYLLLAVAGTGTGPAVRIHVEADDSEAIPMLLGIELDADGLDLLIEQATAARNVLTAATHRGVS